MILRPMLAAKADLKNLDFPLFVSPKLDGVRALIVDGVVMSRSMKPIPNEYVQVAFGQMALNGLDGELIVGEPTADDVYRKTNSAVMTRDGFPDVRFYAFDSFHDLVAGEPFEARLKEVQYVQRTNACDDFCPLIAHPHEVAYGPDGLEMFETQWVEEGYEGVILRHPDRQYKFGRSTAKEQGMLKLKRFDDSEAEVLEVIELQRNGNEACTNELGYTSRSSHKDNLVAAGTMGALRVRDIHTGQTFNIGTGFTQADRDALWQDRDSTVGRIVKYKYFAVGVKDLPRHPVFLGFRSAEDL